VRVVYFKMLEILQLVDISLKVFISLVVDAIKSALYTSLRNADILTWYYLFERREMGL
jgi:hypothetical protein